MIDINDSIKDDFSISIFLTDTLESLITAIDYATTFRDRNPNMS